MAKKTKEWVPVEPPILSPSSINTYRNCPLRFKLEKIDKRYGPGTAESLAGSFVHEVLEYLFKEKPEDRTLETAQRISRERWDQKWRGKVTGVVIGDKAQNDFKWRSWRFVQTYFKMEDPAKVDPIGLETWVDGPVINNIRVRGIVDRLIEDDGKLVIQDYKTGKTPRDSRWEEDRIFPLMVYADLMADEKHKEVSRMELLYLSSGTVVTYEPTEENRTAMYTRVIETSESIGEACKTGDFPTHKSKLCDWCHFKDECPAWS